MIEFALELDELRPRISVIGVGGGGGNAVASMIRNGVRGVDFVAANTDAQALASSPAARIVQLGRRTTQGLGAGSNAPLGRAAAEESIADVERMLEGADMCFIAAGLGGGTGTGAAPVIAQAARSKGILTVGVVTRPFAFEGGRRARTAEAGLEALEAEVDTLIVIPNQNLFRIARPETTFKQAFDLADEVLQQGVRGITDLMVMPGLINLDFADLRTIMAGMGKAMMGTGEAAGTDRALRAAEAAIANPLLDDAVHGARGLIVSITGGEDLGLMEIDEAAGHIKALVDPEADIIWGAAFDPALAGQLRVSVVATGLGPIAEAAPALVVEAARIIEAEPVVQAPEPEPEPAPVVEELLLTAEAPAPEPEPEQASPRPLHIAAAEPEAEMLLAEPIRGPSLFERMTDAARGAVARRREEAQPPLVEAA
ncbi:MAG TPA: cell division protein FtsZ [Allosphingosinicella sp.]|jgi:cell division protein FtsZ|nr:cell division protein FtsZ [Allosphingosinicella sp.]